ncbi:MAG TPA: FAD-binding oxidoreductase, partial [Methylomirabilota bacterium]|nr:FAD-binding oxidoreductase [Methylomirabilota bacterium]
SIAVRAGGHNVAGYAVCEAGVMIDMSGMNHVRVSPDLAFADVEGGAAWGDVDAATTAFGRATPGGVVAATGVAGLTLSGGIGWLRGRHGLACDNIVEADVVTAEGRLVAATETENPDLLWALRGGGGNFGVVTRFRQAIHAIADELFFCAPAYPEERAGEIIPKWRDFMATAPAALSGLAEFSTVPDDPSFPEEARGRRVLALAHVYDGPADEGERVCALLRGYGRPLADFSGAMPYRTIQALYDPLFPKGRDRCYWKSTYLKALDQPIIEQILAWLAKRPSEMTYASIWKFAGAMQDVPAEATAFGDRSAPFMLSLDGIWSSASDDNANMEWVRSCWTDMQRHSTGRMYLNFPGHGEGDDLVKNALGPGTYARLQQVKRKYDPANLFRLNQNIFPAASTSSEDGRQWAKSA